MKQSKLESAILHSLMEALVGHDEFIDVTPDLAVSIGRPTRDGIYYAELWNWRTNQSIKVRFGGCYTTEEVVSFAASLLMGKYERKAAKRRAA